MARKPKLESNALYLLITSVVHAGERYDPGTLLLGSDPVCVARPELFARHDLGHREITRVREAFERDQMQEEAQRRAAERPPEDPAPLPPQRAVAIRRITNPGVGQVEPGDVYRVSDLIVQQQPAAFALLEN